LQIVLVLVRVRLDVVRVGVAEVQPGQPLLVEQDHEVVLILADEGVRAHIDGLARTELAPGMGSRVWISSKYSLSFSMVRWNFLASGL